METRLYSIKEQSGNLELYREWTARHEELQAHISDFQADYDDTRAGFDDSEDVSDTLEELRRQLSEAEGYAKNLDALTEKRIRLATEFERLEELRETLGQLEGMTLCPTCRQEIHPEHFHELKDVYQQQYDALRAQFEQALLEEKEARETAELVKELGEREADLSLRHGKCLRLERELADAHSQRESVQGKLESFAEAGGNERQIAVVETELREKQARLKELEWQERRRQESREQAEQAEEEFKSAASQRLLSEWAADAMQHTLQAITGDSLQKVEASVLDCLHEFDLLSDSSDRSLQLEQSGLMPELDGRKFQMLSGSEKAILYIGIKLAISQLMPGTNFVILDNPTLHLDDTRREQMREYVLGLLSRKQVIVFTNDKGFADSLSQGKRIDLVHI